MTRFARISLTSYSLNSRSTTVRGNGTGSGTTLGKEVDGTKDHAYTEYNMSLEEILLGVVQVFRFHSDTCSQ
jgi:hypothetical protein